MPALTPPDAPEQVIVNPASGERIVLRQTAEQTGGALLVFDLLLPPGGHVPAWHAHPGQEERFTVIHGQLRFRLGGRSILAGPGDSVRVPPRTAHWFGNAGSEPAEARVEVRPALRMQELFEQAASLPHASGRQFNLARLARLLLDFSGEVAVPLVPPALARAVLTVLAHLPSFGQA